MKRCRKIDEFPIPHCLFQDNNSRDPLKGKGRLSSAVIWKVTKIKNKFLIRIKDTIDLAAGGEFCFTLGTSIFGSVVDGLSENGGVRLSPGHFHSISF